MSNCSNEELQQQQQLFEYFVVCGIGAEIRTLDGEKGFHGNNEFYLASLLDQYPPPTHTLYPPPPPQLPTVTILFFSYISFLNHNIVFI